MLLKIRTPRPILYWILLLATWPAVSASAASGFPVTVVHPFYSQWQADTDYLARVDSFGHLEVTAPTSGWLRGPHLAQGAHVNAGMILGTIAPPGFDARLHAARSAFRLARIQLRQARHLYHEHDSAIIALDEARNSFHAAESKVQALEIRKTAYRLRAPADGTVYYRLPAGAFVNDANVTPIIAYVDVSRPLWASVNVPPSQARELKPGMKVRLRRGDWSSNARVLSIGGSALHSGLVQVIIHLPGTAPLRAGEWIHAALPAHSGKGWRLPRAALLMQGNRSFVYVLRHGHAQAVDVHLQNAAVPWVWVSGLLGSESRVIVRGADRVTTGTRVYVTPASNSSGA